jgi:hypothetical protein
LLKVLTRRSDFKGNDSSDKETRKPGWIFQEGKSFLKRSMEEPMSERGVLDNLNSTGTRVWKAFSISKMKDQKPVFMPGVSPSGHVLLIGIT